VAAPLRVVLAAVGAHLFLPQGAVKSLRRFRSRHWVALAVPVLALLLVDKGRFGALKGPCFRDVGELRTWAEGRALFCRSDQLDGEVTDGLAVSTRYLTWEEVGGLCRATPGRGCQWKGIIWAINLHSRLGVQTETPWHGECRVWGAILVTGDRDLLDRIERDLN
jgi:hypothetical protein